MAPGRRGAEFASGRNLQRVASHGESGTSVGSQRAADDNSPVLAEDPFLAALLAAEIDDEPVTEEDREAMRRGREEAARGEAEDWSVVRERLFRDGAPSAKAG